MWLCYLLQEKYDKKAHLNRNKASEAEYSNIGYYFLKTTYSKESNLF